MTNYTCRTCGKECDSWDELADHINKSRDKAHRKDRSGRIWAANYKYAHILKKQERKDQFRTPLTEEQKIARIDTKRILSRKMVIVPVKCPKCQNGGRQFIEKEHADEPNAWKRDNCFMILCEGCR